MRWLSFSCFHVGGDIASSYGVLEEGTRSPWAKCLCGPWWQRTECTECMTSLCSLFFLLSRKVKAPLTCAVWSPWRGFDSPQTHLQPDVRWSDINREAENEITSYSANQKTLFPPRFYFGAAKLLLGESRPDSVRRQPFLISCGIVVDRSKWIDDPITTRCLQSAARSAPRRQPTWQRSPLAFRVNSWKRMTFVIRGCRFLDP